MRHTSFRDLKTCIHGISTAYELAKPRPQKSSESMSMMSPLWLHVSRKRVVVKLCTSERSANAHTCVTMVPTCLCLLQMAKQLIGLAPDVNHDVDGQHYPEQRSHLDKHKTGKLQHLANSYRVCGKQMQITRYENNLLHDAVVQVQHANEEALIARPISKNDTGQCKTCLTVPTGKAAVQ